MDLTSGFLVSRCPPMSRFCLVCDGVCNLLLMQGGELWIDFQSVLFLLFIFFSSPFLLFQLLVFLLLLPLSPLFPLLPLLLPDLLLLFLFFFSCLFPFFFFFFTILSEDIRDPKVDESYDGPASGLLGCRGVAPMACLVGRGLQGAVPAPKMHREWPTVPPRGMVACR